MAEQCCTALPWVTAQVAIGLINAIYTHEGHTLKGARQVAMGRGPIDRARLSLREINIKRNILLESLYTYNI